MKLVYFFNLRCALISESVSAQSHLSFYLFVCCTSSNIDQYLPLFITVYPLNIILGADFSLKITLLIEMKRCKIRHTIYDQIH